MPVTTKSISLTITDIDQTYEHVQLAAIHNTAATGIASTVYILSELPTQGQTSINYIYRGPDATSTILTTPSDLAVNELTIGVVQTHAQLDNRLWLAGISGSSFDYAALQQEANNIAVK